MKWIFSVFLLMIVAWILPGVTIENFWIALVVSLVLGVVQFGMSFLTLLLLPLTGIMVLLSLVLFSQF
jgi:uncharacterized membrane protein YvlD (DUF360 family)